MSRLVNARLFTVLILLYPAALHADCDFPLDTDLTGYGYREVNLDLGIPTRYPLVRLPVPLSLEIDVCSPRIQLGAFGFTVTLEGRPENAVDASFDYSFAGSASQIQRMLGTRWPEGIHTVPLSCTLREEGIIDARGEANHYSFAFGAPTRSGWIRNGAVVTGTVRFCRQISISATNATTIELPYHVSATMLAAESFGNVDQTFGRVEAEMTASVDGMELSADRESVESETIFPDEKTLTASRVLSLAVVPGSNVFDVDIACNVRIQTQAQSDGFYGLLSGSAIAGLIMPGSFRVGAFTGPQGGPVPPGVVISDADVVYADTYTELLGACCLPSDACATLLESECTDLGGLFLGAGSSCQAGTCPQYADSIVCCLPQGSCEIMNSFSCYERAGTPIRALGESCKEGTCGITVAPGLQMRELADLSFLQPDGARAEGVSPFRLSLAIAPIDSDWEPGLYIGVGRNALDLPPPDELWMASTNGTLRQLLAFPRLDTDPNFLQFGRGDFGNHIYVTCDNYDNGQPGQNGGAILRIDSDLKISEFVPNGPLMGEPASTALPPGPESSFYGYMLLVNTGFPQTANILSIRPDGSFGPFQRMDGMRQSGIAITADAEFGDYLYIGTDYGVVRRATFSGGISDAFTVGGPSEGVIQLVRPPMSGPFAGRMLAVVGQYAGERRLVTISPQGQLDTLVIGDYIQGATLNCDQSSIYFEQLTSGRIYEVSPGRFANRAPVVGVVESIVAAVGADVRLAACQSFDPDYTRTTCAPDSIVSYQWRFDGGAYADTVSSDCVCPTVFRSEVPAVVHVTTRAVDTHGLVSEPETTSIVWRALPNLSLDRERSFIVRDSVACDEGQLHIEGWCEKGAGSCDSVTVRCFVDSVTVASVLAELMGPVKGDRTFLFEVELDQLPVGEHLVICVADPDAEVEETDEGDNFAGLILPECHGPVPVDVSLVARQRECGVELEWRGSEDLLRFEVMRRGLTEGADTVLVGAGLRGDDGVSWRQVDSSPRCGVAYEYVLDGIYRSGQRERLAAVTVELSGNQMVAAGAGEGWPIAFRLESGSSVDVEVFDVQGRTQRRLRMSGLVPGEHLVRWDGVTETGERSGSGVYFYRVMGSSGVLSRGRLVIVR